MTGRRGWRWRATIVTTAVVLGLLTGCARGDDAMLPAGTTWSGPDDTSNLWTALNWGVVVDYPFYPSVAELAEAADLVVRGRVVDVAPGRPSSSDHAEVTIEVSRVLVDPDRRKPARVVVSIPVNDANDLARIDAEAPKPEDVIVAVTRLGEDDAPGSAGQQQKAGAPSADPALPPLFGLGSNDAVIDFVDGVSYTPFNRPGQTPEPGDPYRGRSLAELETAFLAAG